MCETSDPEDALSACRELAVLSQVDHPHVVRMHTCDHIEGKAYLVLDRCDADVGAMIRGHRMTVGLANTCGAQLLGALSHLHARSVIHRDVKPANILYDGRTQSFRLCDFGLARVARSRAPFAELHRRWTEGQPFDALTCAVVTRYDRAPELYVSRGTYSSAVDVWSAACVIFELQLAFQSRFPRPLFAASGEGGPTDTPHRQKRRRTTAAHLRAADDRGMQAVSECGMMRAMAQYGVFDEAVAAPPGAEACAAMFARATEALPVPPDPLDEQLARLLPRSSVAARATIRRGLCPWPGARPSAADLLGAAGAPAVEPALSEDDIMRQHGLATTEQLYRHTKSRIEASSEQKRNARE